MSNLARIGHCLRCQSIRRIDEGFCARCLPHISEKFAKAVLRAHTDREFARTIHSRINDADHRERFVRALGYDPGTT